MTIQKPICLIGFMGSGKTTLGKKIAKKLDLNFLDSDEIIEKTVGTSIMEIFENHGEAHFRNLESSFLAKLNFNQPAVISVGGGLPCNEQNLSLLLEHCFVLYLKRSPKELLARVKQGAQKRPLLKNFDDQDLETFIESKLLEREPFYVQAHLILSREEQNVNSLIDKLEQLAQS